MMLTNFSMRFTNILGFFTTGMEEILVHPPDLLNFFLCLENRQSWFAEYPNAGESRLAAAAFAARGELQERMRDDSNEMPLTELLSRARIIQIKGAVHRWHTFALAVARHPEEMDELRESLTAWSSGQTLIVIPSLPGDQVSDLRFDSPFQGVSDIVRYQERWPGALIWNVLGESVFISLTDLPRVFAMVDSRELGDVTSTTLLRLRDIVNKVTVLPAGIRLLHLSDLHFGTVQSDSAQDYLLSCIGSEFKGKFDRIVITGDLVDSPWRRHMKRFKHFLTTLRLIAKDDPILVLGNHDVRIKGNAVWRFGRLVRAYEDIPQSLIVEDSRAECLFFCFNSSKLGNFAKGEVSSEDLTAMAAEYQTRLTQRPNLRSFLRVAVVHHHPFSFDSKAEGWTERVMSECGISDAMVVDMEKSERFVQWCADRGAQLILFGHRHVQREITRVIQTSDVRAGNVRVTAIGCGTSLGAEMRPKSFNIVSWDPNARRWGAEFFIDRHGGGFKPIRAAMG
jgi:hypothetical protein